MILFYMLEPFFNHGGTGNIHLFPLLPNTPELNPIEIIWDDVREKDFHNEIFKNLEAVIDRLCLSVKKLLEDTQRMASITFRKWLMA